MQHSDLRESVGGMCMHMCVCVCVCVCVLGREGSWVFTGTFLVVVRKAIYVTGYSNF